MIVAEELSKSYSRGRPVLEGLSLQVHPGEVTLLVGANGVGKSTTLRILCGLARPDGGEALIGGICIRKARMQAQQQLSYLPQGVAFHPQLTCEAVLRFYAELRGYSESDAVVTRMLKKVGLESEARKRTHALSGGLRQRLGLAVLLQPDAPVLILDEPGLSLDPEWRARLKEMLQIEAQRGKTILIATHLLGEWEGVAGRALHVRRGGNVEEIDPSRLQTAFEGSPAQ